jgi:hypothetical protein
MNIISQYSVHLVQTSDGSVFLFLSLVLKRNKNILCKIIYKMWFSWNVKQYLNKDRTLFKIMRIFISHVEQWVAKSEHT